MPDLVKQIRDKNANVIVACQKGLRWGLAFQSMCGKSLWGLAFVVASPSFDQIQAIAEGALPN
jgi:hypothetical protein